MLKMYIFCAVALLLSGCATRPSELTDTDFTIKTVVIPLPASHAMSNFYEGMRRSGRSGVAECSPIRPNGSATCDIYLPNSIGRSDFVMGRADFNIVALGTSVEMRVQTYIGKGESKFEEWEAFAKGIR